MLLTVKNAGRVLDLFDDQHPEWGPTSVAAELGLGKSTAHLLLSSLAEIGLLRREPRGPYRVGSRAVQLVHLAERTVPHWATTRDVAALVARQSGETIRISVLEDGRVSCMDAVTAGGGHEYDRSTLPLHSSAAGKVLVAQLDDGARDRLLGPGPLPRLTARTIVDRDALDAELQCARRDGVACDREETATGLCAIAAVVRDADGQAFATVGISVAATTAEFEHRLDGYREVALATARAVAERIAAADPAGQPA